MNTVPARFRTDVNDLVAFPGSLAKKYFIGVNDAQAECVDEIVAVVTGVEIDLASDSGHADAVPVTGNAADNSVQQETRPGVGRVAEAERVEQSNGPGAHGKDIS